MSAELIPLQFILSKAALNWSDLFWGYKNNFLTWSDLLEVAKMELLSNSEDISEIELEMELAKIDKRCIWKIADLVEKLAAKNRSPDEEIKKKWLFLCLAWAYERRSDVTP